MSDRLILDTAASAPPLHRLNAVKQLLQNIILTGLGGDGLLQQVAFQGGTALRLLYGLRRYSEDVDFGALGGNIDPRPIQISIARILGKYDLFPHLGHEKMVAANTENKRLLRINIAVGAAGKLRALILADQVQITIEIDLDPPAGVETERRKTLAGIELTAYTLPSLMSGKLHILLARKDREKGRDWYDYLWYRRNGIEPNMVQLQNALAQTRTAQPAATWSAALREIIQRKNWPNLRSDVRPFLERPAEVNDLNEETLLGVTPGEPASAGEPL